MLNIKVIAGKMFAFVDRWHWVFLLLTLPLVIAPSPDRSIGLLIFPILWVASWISRGEPLPTTPFNSILLLLSFMGLVSIYATYDVIVSLPGLSNLLFTIGIFFSVAREGQNPKRWNLLFLAFLGIGIGISGLGLLATQWIKKISYLTPLLSKTSTLLIGLPGIDEGLHPNIIAGTLLWIMPGLLSLQFFLLIRAKAVIKKVGRIQAIALIFSTVFFSLFVIFVFLLTQSRGGYIAFGITVIAMIMFLLPERRRWIIVGSFILTFIFAIITIRKYGFETILDDYPVAIDQALSINTFQGRLELWSRAIYGIRDYPFTGMGINTFRNIVHVFYPLFLISPDYDVGHAHNEFLQIALDLGIPGLVAFLAIYFQAFWMLFTCWKMNNLAYPTNEAKVLLLNDAFVLGLFGGLSAHLLYSLTDAVFFSAKPGFLFGVLLGLISSLFSQIKSRDLLEFPQSHTRIIV